VETLLEQARRVLTFLLGQAQSLHEFLGFVPKEGKEFLDFSPRRELQELDEEGDYHNLAKEVGNTSFFLTESRLNFQNTFLENIQTIGTYLTEVNKITPVQPLRSEIARLSSRLNHLPPLRNRSQALEQLGNIRLREARKTLQQVLALHRT
jgi:hypothetical protein